MSNHYDAQDRDCLLNHEGVPEDKNLVRFKDVDELCKSLIRRARGSLGMKGFCKAQTMPINCNALQHAVRMVTCQLPTEHGVIVATEAYVAEYARHIADETAYWA